MGGWFNNHNNDVGVPHPSDSNPQLFQIRTRVNWDFVLCQATYLTTGKALRNERYFAGIKLRRPHIHFDPIVFDQLGLNDACESFNGNLIFLGQPLVEHILCKTARAIATLLNFLTICIENSVLEIGKVGRLDNKNLVSADAKMAVGKPLDQPGAEV